MPIDPSIPLQIQAVKSPYETLQSNLQMMQGLQSLKQNQMQLGANQAISQAYSQAMNPDGSVDFNKLQSIAAQNGAGAYLPEFMGKIAQQRNEQQQYDTSKLDMALKQQQSIRGMIGSLAADPDLGKVDMSKKIAAQIADAVQAGTLPLEQGIREIQAIPSDPREQAARVQNKLINSLSNEAKLQAIMPKGSVINTGGQQVLLNQNPLTGQYTQAGTVANTLTPGEAAQRIPTVMPNGQPGTVPLGSTVGGSGGGAAPEGYTGRYGAQAGPAGAPGGFLPTGLSPAEVAGQEALGRTANAAAQTLHDAAADAPLRINLLETARDSLGSITTGPGTAWRNTAASFINALPGGMAAKLGVTDPNKIKEYDKFNKILTNYASSVSGALGSGTDARLNAAITGNANPNISTLANEDILAKTIAAERMRAAQDYAFQNSGVPTNQFNQWQAQWNKAVNPEAFVFTSMSPQQQQAFIERKTKSGDLGKFKKDLGNLVRAGLIQAPGGQ